ncbi:uncharacterized protein LOC34623935 [Cyclospora cayetanensis]|uniref:Uncharacterized protein LOC34623935 n=1 Tax=Cyclospora cayetanensis TaxID=88456 RepID=A0A6P6RYA0_9EIME|nr:uncharacterized protein LOC34623935 [Cyclospora cayetanensis]
MKSVVLLLILSVFSVHRYSCLSHLLEAFSVLAFAAAEGSGPSLQELADAAPSPSHIGTASAFTSSLLKEIELGTTVGREAEKQVASAAAKDSGEKEGLLSACAAFSSTEPELWRICLVAANHISALYRRLTVENTLVRRLSPSEFSAAIAEHLQVILEEEDNIAQSVVDGLLPHGALPVFSLKVAIQRKLQSLGLLKPKNAHMTLHYQMKGPTEQEMQEMAAVLWPLVNAHRSRLRLSAHKGVTLLAPEEHSLLWAYMEIYAREHHLVGPERPLNLWRFPEPAGAASLLE